MIVQIKLQIKQPIAFRPCSVIVRMALDRTQNIPRTFHCCYTWQSKKTFKRVITTQSTRCRETFSQVAKSILRPLIDCFCQTLNDWLHPTEDNTLSLVKELLSINIHFNPAHNTDGFCLKKDKAQLGFSLPGQEKKQLQNTFSRVQHRKTTISKLYTGIDA